MAPPRPLLERKRAAVLRRSLSPRTHWRSRARQQGRRRERVSGLGGKRRPIGVPRHLSLPHRKASSPKEDRGLGSRQRSRREHGQVRASSAGTESQGTVLVIRGPCTPGHRRNRPRHLRAGMPSFPRPHPSPPASVGELLCMKLLPHPEGGWALHPDTILLLRGGPWGPYHHSTHTTPHTRQMNGLHGAVRHAMRMR